MKIIKLIEKKHGGFSVVFDEIPELTYERVGVDYVGSATDSDGNIIASNLLKKEPFGNAFGGREITLKMKDGSTETIKDYWFDHGTYKKHGEFISIGAGTLEGLQKCYVYFGYNINKNIFEKMVEDYFAHDKLYEYDEVKAWCNLQHQWYDVVVHGKKIPFMMNKYGDMVEKRTKKRVFPRHNVVYVKEGAYRKQTYFKFKYEEDGKVVNLETSYLEVLKATLPFTEEEIRLNCDLPKTEREEKVSS